MAKVIISQRRCINNEYTNEITDKLNEYMNESYKDMVRTCGKNCGTYLVPYLNEGYVSIRGPGATRGHIKIKDNIIRGFAFYKRAKDCYIEEVQDAVQEYIGCKLIL